MAAELNLTYMTSIGQLYKEVASHQIVTTEGFRGAMG